MLLLAGGLEAQEPAGGLFAQPSEPVPWHEILTPTILIGGALLLAFSAFFSGSEIAFFSLHRLRLRAMQESEEYLDRIVSRLMRDPTSLLTTILMGNSITNVALGVVVAANIERLFAESFLLPPTVGFAFATAIGTFLLVFIGEVTPKLLIVRHNEFFSRLAAIPIFLIDRIMRPLRDGTIALIGFFFRITRFSEMRPAPFMTDEEFRSVLSEGEATGALAQDKHKMIQGIIEVHNVMVREIKVPRPDMVALEESATVDEALALFREHEFARMPVYREHLDAIVGALYAKDLIASLDQGALDQPIKPMLRKIPFVPETMGVAEFMKNARKLRSHMAIVVDEYGGTDGLVTLQDALREVVGDIGEETELSELYKVVDKNTFEIEGGFPIDEFGQLTGVSLDDTEHTTVAGYLMARIDKIPEQGDSYDDDRLRFTVESVEHKRVERMRVEVVPAPEPAEQPAP